MLICDVEKVKIKNLNFRPPPPLPSHLNLRNMVSSFALNHPSQDFLPLVLRVSQHVTISFTDSGGFLEPRHRVPHLHVGAARIAEPLLNSKREGGHCRNTGSGI